MRIWGWGQLRIHNRCAGAGSSPRCVALKHFRRETVGWYLDMDVSSAQAAITKRHRLGGLNNRNFSLPGLEAGNSRPQSL